MNGIGAVAALATFLGVWAGHVLVRRIEFNAPSLIPPTIAAVIIGVLLEVIALIGDSLYVSGACGILGMTALFDAFEFRRQQRRVRKGHAPANPDNPRHVRLLATGHATMIDRLKRDPIGQYIGQREGTAMPTYDQQE